MVSNRLPVDAGCEEVLMQFGARLAAAMERFGPLCVGIDPHRGQLDAWGLPDTPDGLRRFSDAILEAAEGRCAAVKPNASFFERHGSKGVAALEESLAQSRERGILTVLDAKRGDIGSTMEGYAEAYLTPGAPLEADSVTLSPYLGFGSLTPALDLARRHGKGVFVLALTSNPEGPSVQHATAPDGRAVAAVVAEEAAALNRGATPMGDVGLVVGATVGDAVQKLGIDLTRVNGPLLSPGVGAQGAGSKELSLVFGNARARVLVNQSRGVAQAGPSVEKLRDAIIEASDAAQSILREQEKEG